ncbi:four helix bundle protein [Aridibaculum aurantiacum]|uniref:four helix bundle protein n=1 Tax=Aridibaculum aurantiacum TaxID=2810307 RepID=UPI001A96EB07|nr:four helix bundle protein [Aridibaculum aurantiacum]
MRNFQQLEFWKRSHLLTLKIYRLTQNFPKEETYGLTSQMRRSSASISTNIAEGCGRHSNGDFKRFLIISTGSCSELHYQVLLSHDLGYIDEITYKELDEEIIQLRKMIYSYADKLD